MACAGAGIRIGVVGLLAAARETLPGSSLDAGLQLHRIAPSLRWRRSGGRNSGGSLFPGPVSARIGTGGSFASTVPLLPMIVRGYFVVIYGPHPESGRGEARAEFRADGRSCAVSTLLVCRSRVGVAPRQAEGVRRPCPRRIAQKVKPSSAPRFWTEGRIASPEWLRGNCPIGRGACVTAFKISTLLDLHCRSAAESAVRTGARCFQSPPGLLSRPTSRASRP